MKEKEHGGQERWRRGQEQGRGGALQEREGIYFRLTSDTPLDNLTHTARRFMTTSLSCCCACVLYMVLIYYIVVMIVLFLCGSFSGCRACRDINLKVQAQGWCQENKSGRLWGGGLWLALLISERNKVWQRGSLQDAVGNFECPRCWRAAQLHEFRYSKSLCGLI